MLFLCVDVKNKIKAIFCILLSSYYAENKGNTAGAEQYIDPVKRGVSSQLL